MRTIAITEHDHGDRRLALTVFAIVRAPEEGWGAAATLVVLAGGLVLLALFVGIRR